MNENEKKEEDEENLCHWLSFLQQINANKIVKKKINMVSRDGPKQLTTNKQLTKTNNKQEKPNKKNIGHISHPWVVVVVVVV
jgi:hypothetical protein